MSGQGQNQSIDDFIACVIGMGFSLEDAQQAVSLGKLNIEDAIEWILAGKPEPRSPPAATTLRLNPSQAEQGANPIGANPFSNPQPLNLSASGPASSAASSTPGWDGETKEGGEDVVSRIHMSDEQRQIKLNFEEKQRDEARRKAKQEKAAQKKAHAAILKQIQEDRDTQRLRRGAAHTSPGAESASSGSASPRAKEPRTDSPVTPPQTEGPKKCLLQVRLPDGRAIRESFPADAVLREVWNFVSQKIKVDNDMVLMQPFPRQEYGEDHMVQTLTDLGLTPSGSLVLKKREKPQAPPAPVDSSGQASLEAGVSRMSTEPAAGSPGDDSTSPPTSPLVPPAPPALPPQPMHVWGQGQSMQQPEQGEGDEPMEEQAAEEGGPADDGLDQDDGSDSDGDGDQPGGAWGAGGGGQGGGAWGGGGAGGGWGGGGGGGGWGGGGGGGGWGGGGGGGGWGGGGGMGAWGGGLGMGWGGAGGADMDMEGHQWGEGQRLVGEVLNAENMPHHSKPAKELAAEAANVRRAQPDPVPGPSAEEAAAPALAEIPTLVHLIVRQVSGRVCDTRQPITSFQGLPADVAMKILGYLIKERLLRPKTLHPFLSCCLRKMVLDCYPYTTNELLHALRRHTYLTYLSMRDCPLITDKGLAAIRSLKRLKYLNLGNCRQITDTCIPTLQEFRNLVTLVLENTVVTDAGITRYCQRAPPNLQHLTLNHTEVTQAIFVPLTVLTKLKSLNLESTQIQSLTGIEQLTTLEHLNVSGTKLDSESLTCLSLLPRLVALNVSLTLNTEGTGLNGDLALQAIHSLPLQLLELPDRHTTTDIGVQSISRMPLQTLDLSYYIHVTDDATPFIGALTSLTRLRLSNTKITDKGMLHLTGLKHLRELYLNRTAVTDEGAVAVAEFPNLQELGLMSTGITNTFLTSGMLNRCRLLSKLNLSRNYISNRGVVQIKLRCLTLLNLDCTKVKEDVDVTLKQNCPVLKKVMLSNLQPMTDDDMDM